MMMGVLHRFLQLVAWGRKIRLGKRGLFMELCYNMVINIGLLVLIAITLTKIPLVEHTLCDEGGQATVGRFVLGAIFGGFCIVSTCTGGVVQGAIPNTRVLGVLAGGLLCGPIVGITAGVIGAVHRFLFDPHGVTTFACAFSTLLEGFFAAGIYQFLKKKNHTLRWTELLLITAVAEAVHMVNLLIFVKPFALAVDIVKTLTVPMVIINSIGMLLFFSIFKDVYMMQMLEADNERLEILNNDLIEKSKAKPKVGPFGLQAGDHTELVEADNIYYIEAIHKGAKVYCKDKSFYSNEPLVEWEKKLDSGDNTFVRIHRSYIANLTKGESLQPDANNGYALCMKDENHTIIPISRKVIHEIRDYYSM